ncbi:MAG: hypothetical protein ACRD1Z_11770 [Vicinamibacteria bacterium]
MPNRGPDPYRARVARHVNGSKLWRAYFETMAPSSGGATEPWIEFRLVFDREILNRVEIFEYEEGDYDSAPRTLAAQRRCSTVESGE